MAEYIATDTELTSVANAIRAKVETSDPLVFPSGFVNAINAIPTGGGITIVDTPDIHGGTIREIITNGDVKGVPASVEFIDYDGTTVATKTKAQIEAMESDSDLPDNPVHSGLISQGWNWTVAQLKAQLTAMPDQKVYVGQMYITESGKTEIDVVMQEGRLSPTLTICVNGTITVDWGDETTPDTVTGNSETTRKAVQHSYVSAGNYTISISCTTGTFSFYGASSYTLLRKNTSEDQNKVYANCVKRIRLGSGINYIRNYSFYNCYSLQSITIPSSVTSIGNNVFENCFSIQSITIPSNVTSIGTYAFEKCYSLVSLMIPSNVTNIGDYAFHHCYSLSNIAIPSSVTSIGAYAFQSCYSLTNMIIPSNVTNIVNGMFYGCYSLVNVTIPSNATNIGDYAFQYCYSLSNITIPSSVTSIGNSAFYSCFSIPSITIPSSVTSIGNSTFQYCFSLASVTIQSSITSIGNYTFYGCYSLIDIMIPSSVTSIGGYAFQNCYSLASITIPSNVTGIGSSAFNGCYSIASITIPSSVTSIGTSAFNACYGMSEYHFLSTTVPTLESTVFTSIPSDCIIYVPRGKLEDYQTASNWSTYASYMQEES